MKQKTAPAIGIVLGMILLLTGPTHAQRYMEKLGRAMVAINQGDGRVYVGWRLLGTDPHDLAFNLYRSTSGASPVKLNGWPITQSTNWVDNAVDLSQANSYFVRPVLDGQEQAASAPFTLQANASVKQYISIPLQVPSDGTTPDGVEYTYNANDCSVGDLDGDGEYEIILKWDPSNSKDNAQDGYSGNVFLDAYKQNGTFMWRINLGINIRAGAHYTQFMVYDLDSDGRAEVACKTADGTVDGLGNLIGDADADYRNVAGRILSGPEFLTIFDGRTGAALVTVNYMPPRGNVCDWGDPGCYGNRVDRFLACIAYLDAERPSLVMCRGYYTWTWLVAWDWRNGQLTHRWTFNSRDGTAGNLAYEGQGNHNLSVADVDGDGKDEIIYGACAIDDDGTGLWTTGLGHGDAMHVSDIDPERPGLEVWGIHENAEVGSALLDAETGQIIWGTGPGDVGRGVAADLTAVYKGMECWGGTGGLRSCTNQYAGRTASSCNFVIWWDGDHVGELLDGKSSTYYVPFIDKYGTSNDTRLLTATGCLTNNGTKATPCVSADILGDWREEVIWRTSDNTQLRIYTTTIPTNHRIYTLMHDPVYRLGIARQNVAYNQPPHTGFYLGDGMTTPPRPDIRLTKPGIYGDLTGDDIVDFDDLAIFSESWLVCDCNENAEPAEGGFDHVQPFGLDMNGDCLINLYEFSLLAQNWLEKTGHL